MTNTINKVIFGGETLIDLTGDTVTADALANGITAHDKSGAVITGTSTKDSDTSDATAAVAEILKDKTAYARGALLTGTMPNNGAVSGTISTKAGQYTIPQGYHDGSGKVGISLEEREKIVPSSIKAGISILGVLGTYTGAAISAQSKTVTPTKAGFTVQPDSGYDYLSSVVVNPIGYVLSDNSAGGQTATIAG